ncbi:hypothetical protein [Campylobacter hyointestinalis]|uniref:hypothetical protein n=1 Tax=Campylobacter hyointestinalis TaxID=198 RepID=UPI0007C91CE2|nr:hypothetical protein [Campylobacter hyointestinalis]ANE35028.1 hypothetical protein CHL_1739 [Campylobacter hyointestinalis subsp. lawsonii CCUG 27631]RAZ24273.1 hypothetical protein CHL9752_05260 [Campylobacter hyointestinalis subsp. lawsonii]RAZ37881.1 hypothetical protein CHL9426_07680 [Campylobacter hyointestinalis subsp. lawsonii]RAZ46528.1 hypothetical protein CHL14416_04300 [Campylobacter hyointestinalis subsp. lawsonii]RAZ51591.1 hypothetical protein CHL10075_06295 [Campylobacter hy
MKKVTLICLLGIVMAFGGDYEDGFVAFENNDYKKAAKHFKLACDGGDVISCNELGVMNRIKHRISYL